MKQTYSRPSMVVIQIANHHPLLQGSDVYTDDPQKPGGAMSRSFDGGCDNEE